MLYEFVREKTMNSFKENVFMLKVTFQPRNPKFQGQKIVETFDLTPHSNGFVPDYELRALALDWRVVKVEKVS